MNPSLRNLPRKPIAGFMAALLLSCTGSVNQPQAKVPASTPEATFVPAAPAPEKSDSKIQVALLLDTSGSMSGLINQAKAKLWKIVNELATARQDGAIPQLEIALYEYGKSTLPQKEGYLQQLVPLTSNLDKVSEELFALTTNGGDEFCGLTIHEATKNLEWSDSNNDLKLIFIAGNEGFHQGPFNYQTACSDAISKGIIVNTIFCGNNQEGVNTYWKAGADLADGQFLTIDHNQQIVEVETPYDTTMVRLNSELNGTYVVYGASGYQYYAGNIAQDGNALSMNRNVAAERAVSKSLNNYNGEWDLVTAMQADSTAMDQLKDKELPEEMQTMNTEERQEFLAEKENKRKAIQSEILELNQKRNAFLKTAQQSGGQSLDDALLSAIRVQANAKNFVFVNETPNP
ncbi:MAG: hypothetical protein ACFB10_13405 [Salibacteraceae bacterium]